MYVCFPFSFRNAEDPLAERGVDICHETVRLWWIKFGSMFAADIKRQGISRVRGFHNWRWHVDEVFVKANGQRLYLWRAVDHECEILEGYVTKRRDKNAAIRSLENLEHREIGRRLNNLAENSDIPFRRRERAMLRFRQMKSPQKFAKVHASVHSHFNQDRHLIDRQTLKECR